MYHSWHKSLSTTAFNIDNNKKCLLEWFLIGMVETKLFLIRYDIDTFCYSYTDYFLNQYVIFQNNVHFHT